MGCIARQAKNSLKNGESAAQYSVVLCVSLGHVRLCTLPAEMLARLVLLASCFVFTLRLGIAVSVGSILCRTCVSPCSCTSMYTPIGEAASFVSCLRLAPFLPFGWVCCESVAQCGVALCVSLGHVRLCMLPAEMLARLALLASCSVFTLRLGVAVSVGAIHCRACV